MVKPNFFIVGAPKCGTTALSEYLRTHRQIFISQPKEPHFFANDLPGYQAGRTLAEYLLLFHDAKNDHLCIGEASVYYLFSKVAIENILLFNPQAKFIVMLRNPIKMVYSLHSQLLYSRNENIKSFEDAWNMQEERCDGKNIPKTCTDPSVLQYKKVGMLGEQLERLLKIVGNRDKIHIIFFDDFISDTKISYMQTLHFLGVDQDDRNSFPVVNPNSSHRIAALGRFYVNTPAWLGRIVSFSKKMTRVERYNISDRIAKINTSNRERVPISVKFTERLKETFANDISQLEKITGRDLRCWFE